MPITKIIEAVVGSLDEKKRYREYKERIRRLPDNYRSAAEALERYLMYAGGIAKGDVLVSMLEDLADLFEQSAANQTPIREVFGDDPVEFAEDFARNYSNGAWINKERDRLTKTIADVTAQDPGRDGTAES